MEIESLKVLLLKVFKSPFIWKHHLPPPTPIPPPLNGTLWGTEACELQSAHTESSEQACFSVDGGLIKLASSGPGHGGACL